MKELIIPKKINEGDTVAFISISGGRAGDEDMLPRYKLGKRRKETLFKVILKEVHRPDMVIFENVDFIHRTPMTVLPVGAQMEIDCDIPAIRVLESGVL